MSDTNVQNFDPNALADLFPDLGAKPTVPSPTKVTFGGEGVEPDILGTTLHPAPAAATPPVDPATPPADPNTPAATVEADILGEGKQTPVVPTQISDLESYYADRVKNGKFVPINVADDNGNEVPFIPKTAEEYDEVLELQIEHRVQKARKELESSWFESKSPAWKVVSKYAELTQDPADLIPVIQGVQTLQLVGDLDENNLEGAETIVRTRFQQRGDPEELIKSQIDSLKSTDNLIAAAKQFKPIIVQQEQQALNRAFKQREQQEREARAIAYEIQQKAVEELEKPIFGKIKLKSEEKAAIYDLIAEPTDDQGYGIYTAIDELFDKRDFQTLRELALFLSKKDAFYNYLGINIAEKTAASLQSKLRVAGESRSTSGNDYNEEKITIQKNQYKSNKPSFGRG